MAAATRSSCTVDFSPLNDKNLFFPIILSKFVKNTSYDAFFEKKDRKKEHVLYGANNITIIFQK